LNVDFKWAAKLVLVNVLVISGLLLLTEFVSRSTNRVDFPDPVIQDTTAGWPATKEYDPLLFWRMKPKIEKNGMFSTNSLGLRGPEIPDKSEDEFRILSLGESTTYAFRVAYEETYTALLQNIGTIDGKTVRSINAGVPAYTIVQGATYLKHRGLKLDPDLIIIYFGYNDFLPIAFRESRDAGARKSLVGKTDLELRAKHDTFTHRLFYFLAKHSHLVRSFAFKEEFTEDDIIRGKGNPRVPEADRLLMLQEITDLCKSRHKHLIVVIPWYKHFRKHIPLLRRFTAGNNVHVVDLPQMLKDLNSHRDRYFNDSVHPNATGHALIAKQIEKGIRARWPAEPR